MTRRTLAVALTLTIGGAATAHAFGGWAVITLKDLPARMTVGAPTEFTFTVRQHGNNPLSGLDPVVVARTGAALVGTSVEAKAKPGRLPGQYTAQLTVPKAGEWRVTIRSGFGPSSLTLLPNRADDGKATVAQVAGAELGRHLFVAKGCVTCHVHPAVEGQQIVKDVAPDLTGKRFDPAYIALWLADPSIRPPSNGNLPMPNLGLSMSEITALTSFVTLQVSATTK